MAEAERIIDAIELRTLAHLRDRAILGVMGYAWASLDAVLTMQVRDYYAEGALRWVRLTENGIERHEIVDRQLKPLLDAYVATAGIGSELHTPLFRSTLPGNRVSGRSVTRRRIERLVRSFETDAGQPVGPPKNNPLAGQADMQDLIDSIGGRSILALRDRAVLGMLAYTGASAWDLSAMAVRDFYSLGEEYWVRLPYSRGSIKAPSELVALMLEYFSAARPGRYASNVLFCRDRLHPMSPDDVREIVRRRRRSHNPSRT